MPEYIEREKALEITKRTSGDYATAFSEIRQLPAADVVPVVHGEWKKLKGMAPPEYHGKHICSECGRIAGSWGYHELLTNYCPYCGAKMDGGNKND